MHLRLMLENSLTLHAKFLWTHRHCHLNVVDFPLSPLSAVHPQAAILHPRLVFELHHRQYQRFGSTLVHAIGVVVVGKENLMGLQLLQEILDRSNICLCHLAIAQWRTGVEWQVQLVELVGTHTQEAATGHALTFQNRAFRIADFGSVGIARLL